MRIGQRRRPPLEERRVGKVSGDVAGGVGAYGQTVAGDPRGDRSEEGVDRAVVAEEPGPVAGAGGVCCAPEPLDPRDAHVSAVDADLRGLPPTLVAYGGDEMFRDPIRRFVDRLERAGVDATAIEERAMFHVFPILMPWAEASGRVYRAVGRFVRERLEAAATSSTLLGEGVSTRGDRHDRHESTRGAD